MNCPVCKQKMKLSHQDISHNPKNGTQYDRKYFVCKKDDVWLTVEIPKTNPRLA